MSKRTLLLALGLVLSVGANVVLLVRSASSHTDALPRARNEAGDGAPARDTCQKELPVQREAAWAEVLATGEREQRPEPRTARDAGAVGPTGQSVLDVDPDVADEVLCDVARSHLVQHWKREQANVTAAIRRSVFDDVRVATEMAGDLDRFATALAPSDEQREAFATRYRTARLARFEEARRALRREPVDYGSLFTTVRGLFADEDSIVRDLFGEESLTRLRALQAQKRTALLAILATYSDRSWDDAVDW